MAEAWLDGVLALALVGVAWRAVAGRGLFVSVVLYIVYGLLLALAWVRLDAPDVALAEAAIGAGLTGALLLDTAAALGRRRAVADADG
jgi:energy-converting hydrogenase B subunit D